MLITKTHYDVPAKLDGGKPIRIFVIAPSVPGYPNAKFPGESGSATTNTICTDVVHWPQVSWSSGGYTLLFG